MSPTVSRNWANLLICLGLVPMTIWIGLMALMFIARGALLPWVGASIVMGGLPVAFVSLVIAGPAMAWARKLASNHAGAWSNIHQVPFFLGVTVFTVGAAIGIWITVANFQASRQPATVEALSPEEQKNASDAAQESLRRLYRDHPELTARDREQCNAKSQDLKVIVEEGPVRLVCVPRSSVGFPSQ